MKSPELSLSFRTLATAQCVATLAAIGLCWSASLIGGLEIKIAIAGSAQAGVLLLVSLLSLALFSPQKKRPVATLATLWSATSFIRFLVALGGSTLLYYVAQFGLRPLLFSFLLTAFFLLVAETKVLASTLSKVGSQTEE